MNVSQLIPGEGSDPAWYKPIVSVSELARLLGVSVKTIYEWGEQVAWPAPPLLFFNFERLRR